LLLGFIDRSHRFVILRSAATKDLRLLFDLFSIRRRRLGFMALPTLAAKLRKTTGLPGS
jgi:hypothetical protein